MDSLTTLDRVLSCSEITVVSKSLDDWSISLESFIYVSWVSGIFSSLGLWGLKISIGQKFLSSNDILFHHFAEENVVDLNVMCRNPVVEETWWEHHVISIIPELGTVLSVEHILVSRFVESASSKDHASSPDVDVKSGVVQWTVSGSKESRSNRTHDTIDSEDAHPHVVDNSESSMEGMLGIFSLTHLESLEDSSNEAWSNSKLLVHEVLKASCVSQEPSLKSL